MFEVERLAPERGHGVKVKTVDQNAVDDKRHAVILAAQAGAARGMEEVRRRGDGELCGHLELSDGSWCALVVFGALFGYRSSIGAPPACVR